MFRKRYANLSQDRNVMKTRGSEFFENTPGAYLDKPGESNPRPPKQPATLVNRPSTSSLLPLKKKIITKNPFRDIF